MSCCAPGIELAGEMEKASHALPSAEELWLSSRALGEGLRQTDLSVPSVHCGVCIATIEDALKARPEVVRARVNLSTKRVSFVWRESVDAKPTDPRLIADVIAKAGFEAHLFSTGAEVSDELRNQLIRAVAVAGFAAANIMLLSVSVWSGADAATRDLFHWLSAMIAAPALVYSGRFFFRSAYAALRNGHTNMDVPISLAVILSYAMSLYETIHHGEHAWFDATVTLLFFLLIGRVLDHLMRDRARSAIVSLARLSPRGAMVVNEDGSHEYRPVDEIQPGDRLDIAAGDRIPVDGAVLSGVSDLDCSIVNGESAPIAIGPGSRLQAGTLNLTGSLVFVATAKAGESFVAEIMNLMEAAEGGRARYRRIADRAARIYAPAVHFLALAALLGWGLVGGDWKQAMLVAISVLIITCPCALGLAVPVVQVIAAGRLFENGIMVKDGSALERLAEINRVLFDKTGTLTMGRPRLTNASTISQAAMAAASGLARHSRHPLSLAISRSFAGTPADFQTVNEVPGSGLEAENAEGRWRLGNRFFATGEGPSVAQDNQSETVLSCNGVEVAAFCFEDTIRPGAVQAIEALEARNIGATILSGDRLPAVASVAARLNIADFHGGLKPADKVAAVAEFNSRGDKVLMVGDGINDAPALAAAHVSMAPSTAADIGRQAADLVFMRDSLDAVDFAIATARRAGKLIRQNFALAILYNVIAVPVALLGHATPLLAAIAMSSSSIIVVVNSLRLGRRRPAVAEFEARPEEKMRTMARRLAA